MTQGIPPTLPNPFAAHHAILSKALAEGRVVPFLGSGVNLCGRPRDKGFKLGERLPNGVELAQRFAEEYGYPMGDKDDLLRVAQYIATMDGEAGLYEGLHAIFDADYPPTDVHRFFAQLPGRLRSKGLPQTPDPRRRRLLIVTTNYDDVLERAFRAEGERIHVVSYIASDPDRGKFLHVPPEGEATVVQRPEEYQGLQDELPVVLKIHGAIDRRDEQQDSYVITEDDYIDYLTRTDVTSLLPNPLPAQLQSSRFLFLGYSLKDWNLRAIVHRLWSERRRTIISWAILKELQELERRFWMKRDIEIIEADMQVYFEQLTAFFLHYLETLHDPVGDVPSADVAQ